ncbi:MAG: hypothetical protein K2N70_05345 [Helicobacter sp.]|nr:hypothetical protein [Helicobacter sp.]
MVKETFLVALEPENGHICELFDRVREELRKASRSIISAYDYDEMRYENQGCLLITLETSRDCREKLERILSHVKGIQHSEIMPFDGFF